MNSANNIIQWNCRGLNANRSDLELLAQKYNPVAICLQETKVNGPLSFKGHVEYFKLGTTDTIGRAHGGVAVYVKEGFPQSLIHLQTTLQAVAVKITTDTTFTICSIYLPPNEPIVMADIQNLFLQLPQPCIIAGDLNAHNYLWGNQNTDARGNIIEKFLNDNNLCLWNDDSPTYVHPGTGALTSIDLTMCSPQLFLNFSWEVEEDQWGSDHFPLILSGHFAPPNERPSRWQFHKADWTKFRVLCDEQLIPDFIEANEDPLQTFTNTLFDIASQCIPKSNPNPPKKEKPWYTEECKEAIKQRRKALKNFKRQPTQHNLELYRIKRAKARQVVRVCKRKSWREYVSKLNNRTPMKKCWDMIRKISGKGGGARVKHLVQNGQTVTQPKAIADTIAQTIS